jgi:hypothetical protein
MTPTTDKIPRIAPLAKNTKQNDNQWRLPSMIKNQRRLTGCVLRKAKAAETKKMMSRRAQVRKVMTFKKKRGSEIHCPESTT